jgi:hypothetical protein
MAGHSGAPLAQEVGTEAGFIVLFCTCAADLARPALVNPIGAAPPSPRQEESCTSTWST